MRILLILLFVIGCSGKSKEEETVDKLVETFTETVKAEDEDEDTTDLTDEFSKRLEELQNECNCSCADTDTNGTAGT